MAEAEDRTATGPDLGFIRTGRLGDGGPRYTETPLDPSAVDAPLPAEPWNTVTASFFIVIVAFWAWRLRGRYRDFPFLTGCMPILLAGGLGGTLYHGLRNAKFYFYLDVIPISLLGLAGAVFLALKAWKGRGWLYLGASLVAYIGLSAMLFTVVAPMPVWKRWGIEGATVAVNANYAALAAVILIPVLGMLVRTRFRDAGWVVAGVISFGIAWFFRLVDRQMGLYLPQGSHWLWHTFGAIATALLIEYFYRVERAMKGTNR